MGLCCHLATSASKSARRKFRSEAFAIRVANSTGIESPSRRAVLRRMSEICSTEGAAIRIGRQRDRVAEIICEKNNKY